MLLLDEAQELTRNGGQHMMTLRRFLRTKRQKKVIAFFAGTTTSLANCYPTEEQCESSREGESGERYFHSGTALYEPTSERRFTLENNIIQFKLIYF